MSHTPGSSHVGCAPFNPEIGNQDSKINYDSVKFLLEKAAGTKITDHSFLVCLRDKSFTMDKHIFDFFFVKREKDTISFKRDYSQINVSTIIDNKTLLPSDIEDILINNDFYKFDQDVSLWNPLLSQDQVKAYINIIFPDWDFTRVKCSPKFWKFLFRKNLSVDFLYKILDKGELFDDFGIMCVFFSNAKISMDDLGRFKYRESYLDCILRNSSILNSETINSFIEEFITNDKEYLYSVFKNKALSVEEKYNVYSLGRLAHSSNNLLLTSSPDVTENTVRIIASDVLFGEHHNVNWLSLCKRKNISADFIIENLFSMPVCFIKKILRVLKLKERHLLDPYFRLEMRHIFEKCKDDFLRNKSLYFIDKKVIKEFVKFSSKKLDQDKRARIHLLKNISLDKSFSSCMQNLF